MIEIDYKLLSKEAVDNLIMELIIRDATDYGAEEVNLARKKNQIISKLERGEAIIMYSSLEGYCSIVSLEEKRKLLLDNQETF
ncbi:MAG: YheU family protein [Tatlockia sp.]|nr:YheU family protein [Tatlockia sp.]